MNKICGMYNCNVRCLHKINWLPPLLARLSLGSIFILSGWGKLHDQPKVVEFFTALGIPAPEFHAMLVALTEFGGGMLILFGLFTRLASIPLMITMIVAIITAKREDLGSITDLLAFEEFVYVVIFSWLIVEGAGKASLDFLLSKRCPPKV